MDRIIGKASPELGGMPLQNGGWGAREENISLDRQSMNLRKCRVHRWRSGPSLRSAPVRAGCFRSGWVWARRALGLSVGLVLVLGAQAHDVFKEYVRHRIELTRTTQNLDLSFELTFYEESSEEERRLMDADGNGRIGRGEMDLYVKGLSRRLTNMPAVFLNGRSLRLAALYEPEVDLLGQDGVGRAHHRLGLSFFVLSPPVLRAGDVLRVEDPYWPSRPALVVLQGTTCAAEGIELCAEAQANPLTGAIEPGETRDFTYVVESSKSGASTGIRLLESGKQDDGK